MTMQTPCTWSKPDAGWFKCNVDSTFFSAENCTSMGICSRDERGYFIATQTEWFAPMVQVHIGEALELLSAMKWV